MSHFGDYDFSCEWNCRKGSSNTKKTFYNVSITPNISNSNYTSLNRNTHLISYTNTLSQHLLNEQKLFGHYFNKNYNRDLVSNSKHIAEIERHKLPLIQKPKKKHFSKDYFLRRSKSENSLSKFKNKRTIPSIWNKKRKLFPDENNVVVLEENRRSQKGYKGFFEPSLTKKKRKKKKKKKKISKKIFDFQDSESLNGGGGQRIKIISLRKMEKERRKILCKYQEGTRYLFKNDYEKARSSFLYALRKDEENSCCGNIFKAKCISYLGGVCFLLKEIEKSRRYFERSLEVIQKMGKVKSFSVLLNKSINYANVGLITKFFLKDYGKAIYYFDKALIGNRSTRCEVMMLKEMKACLEKLGRRDDSLIIDRRISKIEKRRRREEEEIFFEMKDDSIGSYVIFLC